MIKITNLTVKNFLSVGNVTQALKLDHDQLILVLGENMDLGGDDAGSRNGVGKTTIANALSYAVYGQALSNIKKDNLINKSNQKNMITSVEWESNGVLYRVERGRRPNVLRFYVNSNEYKGADTEVQDESQGDSRETQKAIETAFGVSHTMFKHIVALNTYTEPFLTMKSAEQRQLIEELLGITQLGLKADQLKEQGKLVKDQIQGEEIRIKTVQDSNTRIGETIRSFEIKSSAWESKKRSDLADFNEVLTQLETLDITEELARHTAWETYRASANQRSQLVKLKAAADSALSQAKQRVKQVKTQIDKAAAQTCPTCSQTVDADKHEHLVDQLRKDLNKQEQQLAKAQQDVDQYQKDIDAIGVLQQPGETFYDTVAEAYQHQSSMRSIQEQIETTTNTENPYTDQIDQLRTTALQEVDYEYLQQLTKLRDHQEFLLKLLTSKDSFIRKSIIDQNLNYLNQRLGFYLAQLGLPHSVKFLNDLSVEITELGRDLDFDNLSRGERNRLILGMSWAFRDVWESLYQSINILFVDELIDNGLDASGVDSALGVLKKMTRDRHKSVFLISHRDDLISRVNSVLKVIKLNGYTEYSGLN